LYQNGPFNVGIYNRKQVRVTFKKLLFEAGLPHMHFQRLRHSTATILLSMGVPPNVVKELLGHRDIRISLGIYGHVLPGMQQEVMVKMDGLFGGKER
jgi:integrase